MKIDRWNMSGNIKKTIDQKKKKQEDDKWIASIAEDYTRFLNWLSKSPNVYNRLKVVEKNHIIEIHFRFIFHKESEVKS